MTGETGLTRFWTPQQHAAITPGAASVALSAGAGCGKTSVLTERFLRCLEGENAVPLGRLVALTFTEKAARELRGRVRSACRQRMQSGGADAAMWRNVLRGLEAAPIGTFHAFCAQVLRKFPIEAGVEPGFAIVEETLAPALRDEALAGCARSWLAARDPDYIALAVDLGIPAVADRIARLMDLRSRGDLALWAIRDPAEVVVSWQAAWQARRGEVIATRLQSVLEPIDGLIADPSSFPEAMRSKLEEIVALGRALPTEADPDPLLDRLRSLAMVKGAPTKKSWPDGSLYDATKQAFDDLRKTLDDLRQKTTADPEATLEAARQAGRLARLTLQALDAYDAAKREAGMLDFEDLQLRTRDLLRARPPAVSQWIDESIGRILVDEFQDTDPVQAEVSRLLSGGAIDDGRLFLVGDGKQSIYRFRGAQPGIFEEFRAALGPESRLHMTENFRSVTGILAFVNHLFADTFVGAEHILTPGPHSGDPDTPAVEFLWTEPPESDNRRGPSTAQRRKAEAQALARHLRAMIDGRHWMIREKGGADRRAAKAGDVVLLFRTLNDAADYEAALSQVGLDYHIVKGAAFFGQQEVLDVINVLTVLDDPHDEVALAATLRGPFGCVSDAGLFWLANSSFGGLPEGFARWAEVPSLAPLDRQRTGRLHGLLTAWRRDKDFLPIARLLERVLDESGFEAALPAEFLGERRRANVRKLVRLARRFDAHGGFTLADFTARLRANYRDPPREAQAATTDEEGDAVRLMTIHQAKGLEFPVVVLPDLNRKENPSRADVAFDPALGVIVRPPGELEGDDTPSGPDRLRSLGWIIHEEAERREEMQEALRLFYVATTRARDVLVLSACLAPAEPPQSHALRLLDTRFDRSTGAALKLLPGTHEPCPRVVPCPAEALAPVRASRSRAGLLRVAHLIRHAPRIETSVMGTTVQTRPWFMDLDPSRFLAPHAARVDRLIRAALTDPAVFTGADLPSLLRRAAARRAELVSASLITEATRRLEPWCRGDAARALAAAVERVAPFTWSVAWPPGDPEPVVYSGRADFLTRDRHDAWTITVVADPTVSLPHERLRLALSAHAAIERTGGRPATLRLSFLGNPRGPLLDDTELAVFSVGSAIADL